MFSTDVHILVKPNQRVDLLQRQGTTIIARIAARAIEGKANGHLVKVLADHFGVPPSSVQLLKGERSPHKTVRILAEPSHVQARIMLLPESPA